MSTSGVCSFDKQATGSSALVLAFPFRRVFLTVHLQTPLDPPGGYQATDGTKIPLTLIGLLDKRVALQEDTLRLFPSPTPSARPNADVCIMASKIVYEDEAVVRDVINRVWNSPVQVTEDGRGIKVGLYTLATCQIVLLLTASSTGPL